MTAQLKLAVIDRAYSVLRLRIRRSPRPAGGSFTESVRWAAHRSAADGRNRTAEVPAVARPQGAAFLTFGAARSESHSRAFAYIRAWASLRHCERSRSRAGRGTEKQCIRKGLAFAGPFFALFVRRAANQSATNGGLGATVVVPVVRAPLATFLSSGTARSSSNPWTLA